MFIEIELLIIFPSKLLREKDSSFLYLTHNFQLLANCHNLKSSQMHS